MNNDNILIKIVSTFNECIFSNTDYDMKVSDMVSRVLSYGGYNVSDCRFKVKNLSGNLDMCFIYDEVNTSKTQEVINVDDARGTRVIVVIFVNNLLNKLRKVRPTDEHPYCYKIYNASGTFLGFAKKYEIKNDKVMIKREDFDRKIPKGSHQYKIPCNDEYIKCVNNIFVTILNMIKPLSPAGTITSLIYSLAPMVMALYSHKVTIGDPTYYEYDFNTNLVDMVNQYDLLKLLDGKIIEACR